MINWLGHFFFPPHFIRQKLKFCFSLSLAVSLDNLLLFLRLIMLFSSENFVLPSLEVSSEIGRYYSISSCYVASIRHLG